MPLRSLIRSLPFLAVGCLLLAGCGGKGLASKFKDAAKGKKEKTHFEIHQPHHIYKNDKVLIWHGPQRNKRKFLLPPGTRVKVLTTVNGQKYGQEWDMYKIQTSDGRVGWVPSGWCKEKKGP